jgi:transcriptional regulator with XRE-family HTH domain
VERFAGALGTAIRAARERAGLSLRDLERLSDGRFKPSAVGGYERGERDISAERFVTIAYLVGRLPEDLLADALRALFPRSHRGISIDLKKLHESRGDAVAAVGGYARQLQVMRRDYFSDVITFRSGDLEIVAADAGVKVGELLRTIEPAVVRLGPGPDP